LITPALRDEMGKAAVAAANAVRYYNAGTIEFIVDPDTVQFYFLEMNTRLQVEHPVTELTTGLDLVQWQIRVAAGERFPYSQEDLVQRGQAIECRIYAEDPANGFLPSTGKLLQYIEPRGPGIRVDSGFRAGDIVTHLYDPMLAKLIIHAENREQAIQKMQAALREFIVHGVLTNIDFLQDALSHPDFAKGKVSTRWVENDFKWTPTTEPSFESLIAASLVEIIVPSSKARVSGSNEIDPYSPWKNPSGFRIGKQ
jgi:acetyl/propionyl-CoA carboxylase alpha subunit